MKIEVVVYTIESALRAQQAGADRIELCDNPAEGGTTPSWGVIQVVKRNLNIETYVMIRPRGGDFYYSNLEFEAMKHDIQLCKQLNVDGIVLGILLKNGKIDKQRCAELIKLAHPMKVTCHRAFDMTPNAMEALEDCIEVGFIRILTSGQRAKAIDGVELITSLVDKAKDRIIIMPGSGVNENTVQKIVSISKVKEIHFSAAAYRESEMDYHNGYIENMGAKSSSEYMVRTVDPDMVKRIKRLAEN